MSLNKNELISLHYAIKTAKDYHTPEKFAHVSRVAAYVADMPTIPDHYKDDCIILAFMHDLSEDTNFKINDIPSGSFKDALLLLTHAKDTESYETYLKKIRKASENKLSGMYAYYIEIANIKDHLNQTVTLTPPLKEKYLNGLAILL